MCGLEKGTRGGILMYSIGDLGAESLHPDLRTSVTGERGWGEWYYSYLTLK